MVKSEGEQRESDGVVVPGRGSQSRVGKGPGFDHARGAGKRKGMAGTARSNYPGRPRSADTIAKIDNVRRLQRKLWAAAKQSPERRFHALFDRVHRGDVLVEAWRRVRANKGAAGVDRQSLEQVQGYGIERLLGEISRDLREGRYRPSPARRVEIPKADGGRRPLGIPTVRDRIVQQAVKIVLEPIFEAGFCDASYGFRPRRSATQAMERLRTGFIAGGQWVVEADIRDFFGSIDHDKLMAMVAQRVSDRRVLKLIRLWLQAGVLAEGQFTRSVAGTPQGGVISPLLANIYLHGFDKVIAVAGAGELVRYADDFVIICGTPRQAEAALAVAGDVLAGLGLQLHPGKTKVVDLRDGREGFGFLGCHFRARMSGRLWEQKRIVRYYLHRWPSQRAMKRCREKIHTLTDRRYAGTDVRVVVQALNPVLRGWGNYAADVHHDLPGPTQPPSRQFPAPPTNWLSMFDAVTHRTPAQIHRVRAGRRSRGLHDTGSLRAPSRLAHQTRPIRQCWAVLTSSRLLPPRHGAPRAQAAASFTPLLRQRSDGGLSPPSGLTAPRGARRAHQRRGR